MIPTITTTSLVATEQNKALAFLPPNTPMTGPLIPEEKRLLEFCEKGLEEGMDSYIRIGFALSVIREKRLYRETHDTYDNYADDRWNFSRQYAYQIEQNFKAWQKCQPLLDIRTQTVADELSKFDPSTQIKVAEQAAKMVEPDEPATRKTIQSAAAIIHAKPKNPKKTKVDVSAPPSQSKAKPSKIEKQIAELESKIDSLPRGSMLANKLKAELSQLKFDQAIASGPKNEMVKDAEIVPEPIIVNVVMTSPKENLLAELEAFKVECLSEEGIPLTVSGIFDHFVSLIEKHWGAK